RIMGGYCWRARMLALVCGCATAQQNSYTMSDSRTMGEGDCEEICKVVRHCPWLGRPPSRFTHERSRIEISCATERSNYLLTRSTRLSSWCTMEAFAWLPRRFACPRKDFAAGCLPWRSDSESVFTRRNVAVAWRCG